MIYRHPQGGRWRAGRSPGPRTTVMAPTNRPSAEWVHVEPSPPTATEHGDPQANPGTILTLPHSLIVRRLSSGSSSFVLARSSLTDSGRSSWTPPKRWQQRPLRGSGPQRPRRALEDPRSTGHSALDRPGPHGRTFHFIFVSDPGRKERTARAGRDHRSLWDHGRRGPAALPGIWDIPAVAGVVGNSSVLAYLSHQ